MEDIEEKDQKRNWNTPCEHAWKIFACHSCGEKTQKYSIVSSEPVAIHHSFCSSCRKITRHQDVTP